jgi:hypothetical protein
LRKLAREQWLEMGSDAELVVLSMGLALRDIFVVQFIEEGDSKDYPDEVKHSPLNISDAEDLMEIWKKRLPAEKDSASDSDGKGKGKEKVTRAANKRKGVPPLDDSSSEKEKPE